MEPKQNYYLLLSEKYNERRKNTILLIKIITIRNVTNIK